MKVFSPEKELRKIQKGNKNKIILFVALLLIVSAVSYSFALYQIRYSKQIIYTTVAPFNKKDIIISVKLDDQEKSTDKFPEKEEGYVYSHIECENGNITNESWNEDYWNLTASINGPDKCTVFFVKSPFHMKSCENKTMSECLLEEGQKFENILAFDDPDQNGRYIGANPNNYIWFNCDDYDNLTQTTAAQKCEKWRIIGAFNNIDKVISVSVDATTYDKQDLVKIIRADSIGNIAWDTTGGTYGSNNWARPADLQSSLNNEYLNDTDDGSWIPNQKDVNYKPITNTTKENMIENVKWNLGACSFNVRSASELYTCERGDLTRYTPPATLDGRIAIMYISDYVYAYGGNNSTPNRKECLEDRTAVNSSCYATNWLSTEDRAQHALTEYATHDSIIWNIGSPGGINCNSYRAIAGLNTRPTLYLKSTTQITGGQGTFEEPYIIK